MTQNNNEPPITTQAMNQLAAGRRGEATFSDQALDEIADRLEDELDGGDLSEALQELSSLAALLEERGLRKAAGLLARVVASFEGAVTELIEEE